MCKVITCGLRTGKPNNYPRKQIYIIPEQSRNPTLWEGVYKGTESNKKECKVEATSYDTKQRRPNALTEATKEPSFRGNPQYEMKANKRQ